MNRFDHRTVKIIGQFANIAEEDPKEMVENAMAHIRAGFVMLSAVAPSEEMYLWTVKRITERVLSEGMAIGKSVREEMEKIKAKEKV